jgi:fumarate hydratase class II
MQLRAEQKKASFPEPTMSNTRIEHDNFGEICVPADRLWGAQTQRLLETFRISGERMPLV